MNLSEKSCVPCRGGVPPLQGEELEKMKAQVLGWEVKDGHHLFKAFIFADFVSALAFVNRIGEIAEQEGHHPDLYLTWGKVEVKIWTHKINGLTESDFILAGEDRPPIVGQAILPAAAFQAVFTARPFSDPDRCG